MSNNEEISHFIAVTGATPEAAAFFLDSANGNVAAAMDHYYQSDGAIGFGGEGHAAAPQTAAGPPQSASQAAGGITAGSGPYPGPSTTAAAKPKKAASRPGNIASLADLNKQEEDDSDEDDTNELYTGGAKSGQVVRRPNKDSVEGLFDQARKAGAEAGSLQDPGSPGGSRAFRGTARTLAGDDVEQADAEPEAPKPILHTITFYRNGIFTVDDGEPRNVADPANRAFLESISKGECPQELAPPTRDVLINVNMVRKDSDYEPPARPRHQAFQGTGRTLTADGAGTSGSSASAAAVVSLPQSAATVPWEGVKEGEPKTSIQLRLSDGTRMVAQFNTTHTVADIRRFIAASRPDLPTTYSLLTAFPSAQLNDNSVTIAAAGLQNAVIIQKL